MGERSFGIYLVVWGVFISMISMFLLMITGVRWDPVSSLSGVISVVVPQLITIVTYKKKEEKKYIIHRSV